MKANEFLRALCQENLNLEFCGVASGDAIITAGPYRYFGSESSGIGIKKEFDYFYYYGEHGCYFAFLPTPSVVLHIDDVECVYLWEIEL